MNEETPDQRAERYGFAATRRTHIATSLLDYSIEDRDTRSLRTLSELAGRHQVILERYRQDILDLSPDYPEKQSDAATWDPDIRELATVQTVVAAELERRGLTVI